MWSAACHSSINGSIRREDDLPRAKVGWYSRSRLSCALTVIAGVSIYSSRRCSSSFARLVRTSTLTGLRALGCQNPEAFVLDSQIDAER